MRPTTYGREAFSFPVHEAYAHNVRMVIIVILADIPSFTLWRRVHDTIPVPGHISHICIASGQISINRECSYGNLPARIYMGPFEAGMTEKSVRPSTSPFHQYVKCVKRTIIKSQRIHKLVRRLIFLVEH